MKEGRRKAPFLAVRAITGCTDKEAKDNFEENCKKVSEKSAEFVRLLLKKWKE
ncbi:5'-methylthioadenosine/S-adenosylhomocysteine nucleosidase [Blautia sp. Marseille-P3201T]|uniref:5'-methylthioadenosine/S-adenosylhomocysteine nucleosidase n=1 Tax=Blautia sp. Marseille-P3201T TaxID=1907659 RepID=UPI000A48F3EC|nr:5'-methylthioadenosine/S-adenosylhomocysteine nucleosidase [Blautia sp. Marseille-P3201T]